MAQYFESDLTLTSRPELRIYSVLGDRLELWTDRGVFSHRGLDIGTRVLLESLSPQANHRRISPPEAGARCLDLGCGVGVIGLYWKTWYPMVHWHAIDTNSRACELTQRNAQKYGFTVETHTADATQWLPEQDGFSWILTNPPVRIGKVALYHLLSEAYQALLPGGTLCLVIGKKQGAASLQNHLMSFGGLCHTIGHGSGFVVYAVTKTESGSENQ